MSRYIDAYFIKSLASEFKNDLFPGHFKGTINKVERMNCFAYFSGRTENRDVWKSQYRWTAIHRLSGFPWQRTRRKESPSRVRPSLLSEPLGLLYGKQKFFLQLFIALVRR